MPITQNNLLTLKEIHVNPNLWRDKIYYLERNPYWNTSYDYIPTPKKYAEIIQEFHNEIDKQKQQVEKVITDKKEAEERIGEIIKELREWIETILATYGEPTKEEQDKVKSFNLALRLFTVRQWKKWVEDTWPAETIIENEPAAVQLPSAQFVPINGEEPDPQTKELNQKIEVREIIAPQAIKEIVQEWEEQSKKIQTDYNSCFILEHTQESLKFCFQPPRQVFVNLNQFLFYRNNTWYEVSSWTRINNYN